jgi:hypothetical protein
VRFIVCHCAWAPEREAPLRRIMKQIPDVQVLVSEKREHAYVWARRAWREIGLGGEPTVLLNDDVLLHPEFAEICEAMVAALPGELLSLHANMPGAVDAAKAGHHWARCYWYTGPGVILWPETARALLEWDAPFEYVSRVNEDVVAIMHAWEAQHPVYCAIPAPLMQDTLISSTLGYDGHANRTPTVPWTTHTPDGADLTDPAYWRPTGNEPTVENPWMPVAKMETIRRCIREGLHVCTMCTAQVALTGGNGAWLCRECLVNCTNAAIRR